VLPESDDDRILQATASLLRLGIADVTLLGDDQQVRSRAATLGADIAAAQVISPDDPDLRQRCATEYVRLRADRGMTQSRAADILSDPAYFGTMLVRLGLADGMVAGAVHTTADTLRPAFQIIRTAPDTSVVSSVFLMCLADRVLVYGDCAVIP